MAFTTSLFFNPQSTNYTLLASDDVVQFNCASASLTATLLSATLVPVGKRFEIRRASDATPANILTVNTTSAQTIDGRASGSVKLAPGDYLIIVSDGTNWQVVGIQETIAMFYNTGAGTLTNGTINNVQFTNKIRDTHNAYNTGTGVYTIPSAGSYAIGACLQIDGTYGLNFGSDLYIYKNGSQIVDSFYREDSSHVSAHHVIDVRDYPFAAGDTLEIRYAPGATAPITFSPTAIRTHLSIVKVGN